MTPFISTFLIEIQGPFGFPDFLRCGLNPPKSSEFRELVTVLVTFHRRSLENAGRGRSLLFRSRACLPGRECVRNEEGAGSFTEGGDMVEAVFGAFWSSVIIGAGTLVTLWMVLGGKPRHTSEDQYTPLWEPPFL
jgi:hypothetical protein